MSRFKSASPVAASLSIKDSPSALMNTSTMATRREIKIANVPRMTLNASFPFLVMANPPDLLRSLSFQTEHVFAHQLIVEIGGVLEVGGDLAAVHHD